MVVGVGDGWTATNACTCGRGVRCGGWCVWFVGRQRTPLSILVVVTWCGGVAWRVWFCLLFFFSSLVRFFIFHRSYQLWNNSSSHTQQSINQSVNSSPLEISYLIPRHLHITLIQPLSNPFVSCPQKHAVLVVFPFICPRF